MEHLALGQVADQVVAVGVADPVLVSKVKFMEENQNTPPLSVPVSPEAAPLVSVMPSNPTKHSYTSLIIGVLFVLLVASGVSYYVLHAKKTSSTIEQSIAPNETYLQLKNNPEFILAQEASIRGRYADAIELYAKVTPQTTGEYSYIQYEIAANTLSLNETRGVRLFGDIIASSSVNFENKAYSLLFLNNYYTLTQSTGTLTLIRLSADSWKETVAEESLTALRTATNPDDARIALMKMSTSLYPTSGAHTWLGYLYARKAQEVNTKNPENTEGVAAYIEKAETHLTLADTDPDKTKESENLKSTVPSILLRKAMTLAILEKIGQPKEIASETFEKAIELATKEGVLVPFFYYHYAVYLVSKQQPDEEKIRAMLIKIVEMKESEVFTVFRDYIRHLLANKNTETLTELFAIYPPLEEAAK